ncbi:MAG: tetratricopeptide repeat protein [Candidatus Thiodiazotropha sp.]
MQLPVTYQKTLLCLALFIITFALYSPILDDEFVWDAAVLHQDASLNSMDNLFSGFTTQAMPETRENGQGAKALKYYRPFTRALHVVEHQFFALDPFGYKLTNILLHATVVILLFAFVASVQGSKPVAFLSALLFLVKPIHTEAVAWAYSDSYLLMSVFALTSLLAFRLKNHLFAMAAFVLALLSHEIGVLLFPVVALYVFLVEKRATGRELICLLPYLLLTLAFLGLRRWVVGPLPLSSVDPFSFLNTAAFVFAKYSKIFFWPDAPVTVYLRELYTTPNVYSVVGYLLMALAAWASWLLWHRDRQLLFWFLWFFVWSAVSYNIGSLGAYMMAEKLIYLASAGLGVVVVTLLARALGEYPRPLYAGLCVVALVYAVNTSQRLPYWHDTRSYLQKALEHTPDFPIGWYTMANEYRTEGNYDQALKALQQVVKYDANFSLAHNNIGNIHYIQGRIPQAVGSWKKASHDDPTNPQPYFNIGMAMQQLGRPKEALEYYERYLMYAEQPDPRARQQVESLRSALGVSSSQ